MFARKSLDFTVYAPDIDYLDHVHTDTYGFVCVKKLSYDKNAIVTWDDFNNQEVNWKGIANSDGYFYLSNYSDDETYFYIWEARLAILEWGSDEKDHNKNRIDTLAPGETFAEKASIYYKNLSLPVGRTGAPRGTYYTMLATYTLTVTTGHVNVEDSCQAEAEYTFFHGDESDE